MDSQSGAESDKWISDDEWEDISSQTRRRLFRNMFDATASAAALADYSQGGNEDMPTPLENEDSGGESVTTDDDSINQSSGRTPDHIILFAPTNARLNLYDDVVNFLFR